jgi:hypothetical protein
VPTAADVLLGCVLPAVLAGLGLLALRRAAWGPGAGAALAAGGGYVVAHLAQRGWRGFPPAESSDWPWVAALAGLLLGASGATRRGPRPLRLVLRYAAAAAVAWFVLAAWRRGVDARVAQAFVALAAAGSALVWTVLELRQPGPGWFMPATLALTAAGAAAAIGLSGSARLALMAGGLCGVLAAGATAVVLRCGPSSLEGAAAPATLVLAALLLAAAHYSDLPRSSMALIAAAPPVALLPRSLLGPGAGRGRLELLLLAGPLALLASAVKLAVDASPSWEGY